MNHLVSIAITFLLLFWGMAVMMSPMMVTAKDFRDHLSFILFVMAILGFPVILFGILKLINVRYFGMNVTGWLIGFSLVCSLIFIAYGFPKMLLNIQKGIPNTGYFITESTVFLDGNKLKDADPKSFQILEMDARYAKDKQHLFYNGEKIKQASPLTFAPVPNAQKDSLVSTDTPVFWKDAKQVYYNGKAMDKADPATFQHLQGIYAKDAVHVYYLTEVIEGADPSNFRFLNENISIDDSSVFVLNKKSNITTDINSFTVIETENQEFCRDSENVYLIFYQRQEPLEKVEGADVKTFTTLERNYATDKNHVYFFGNYKGEGEPKIRRLEGANPKEFVVGYDESTQSEATDSTRHYMYGAQVKQ